MNSKKAIAVICQKCQTINPESASICSHCSSEISAPPERPSTPNSTAETVADLDFDDVSDETLAPGTVLAERYEIIRLLGRGGMGAVYQAFDRELQRNLALKTIRSDLASQRNILERFKREVIVSSQITHRNVVRVYDLGSAGRLRFLTMEFVEGKSLDAVIGPTGMPPEKAAPVLRQICLGLEAAHERGVIHRDLKPQNIMVEPSGRVAVMDFGLASTTEGGGLTRAGALLGTPDYMSPEQALGRKLDQRSDIFSLGIIAYEMVTGKAPFASETAVASLVARTSTRAVPPREINATVPEALSNLIHRCLATNPQERYNSVNEILQDLESYIGTGQLSVAFSTWDGASAAPAPAGLASPAAAAAPGPRSAAMRKRVALAAGVLAVVAAGVYFGIATKRGPAGPVGPMTVMIADFANHTGDQVFSGTLESSLKLVLEGASFIAAYDHARLRDLGVRPAAGAFDQAKAQEIAAAQGLNVVVSGSLDRRGSEYRLSAAAIQTLTGKVLASDEESAPGKDQVLFAVTKLGTALRKSLGDVTSESTQRLSMETLSAASLEAVHEYAMGLDALSAGKFEESQRRLSGAIDLDPKFGMAYTVMASAARNLGRQQDADRFIKEALKNIDHMTERERYRTRAYLYLQTGDYQKCVDEYGALLQRYPSDTGAHLNIAVCYLHLHDVSKALEESRRAVEILPKRAIYHGNLAMSLAFSGDADGAAKEAGEAAKLGYVNSPLLEAYASLLREQPEHAAEQYRALGKNNSSDATTGLADLAAYEGRFADAAALFEKGAAADLSERKPDTDAAATKLWGLALAERARGQKPAALAAARRSLELSKAFQTRFVAAQVYADLGETAKAHELASGLASELQIEPQAFASLIEGEAALKGGDAQAAVKLFTAANNLLDTWIGRFDLGRAYLELGAFPQADSEFDRCLKRRGEALALFLDLPTYSFFPSVYYYQGRAREGMKSAGAAESYKKYLVIRGKAGEDPLLPEIRRRAAH